ncbi:hypothetical protein LINGRAHAP2_LOCUS24344, partial [Linum grandiflorum]
MTWWKGTRRIGSCSKRTIMEGGGLGIDILRRLYRTPRSAHLEVRYFNASSSGRMVLTSQSMHGWIYHWVIISCYCSVCSTAYSRGGRQDGQPDGSDATTDGDNVLVHVAANRR